MQTSFLWLALLCLQSPPQEPVRATTNREVQIDILPSLHLRWYDRDGALNETVRNMNDGLIGPAGNGDPGSDNGVSGRVTLRGDVLLTQDVRLVLELENKTIDQGGQVLWGEERAVAAFEQSYIEIDRFIAEPLRLQIGSFDLVYRLRPHDDPFLLDLHESESAFTLNTAGGAVRNTVERDTLETAGVKARWETLAWAVDLFGVTTVERGSSSADESLSGVFAELRPREYLSLFTLVTLADGEEKGTQVWTAGGGVDYHAAEYLELFGEAYANLGTLRNDGSAVPSKVTKRQAWGGAGGARVTWGGTWAEASYALRTGDEDPADNEDNTFQSYENEDRFLIVQDDEFGLDIDSNVQSAALGIGMDGIPIGKEHPAFLNMRGEIGFFELDEDLFAASGTSFFRAGDGDLGREVDVTIELEQSRSAVFYLKGAYLFDSDLLEGLTRAGDDRASLFLIGLRVGL